MKSLFILGTLLISMATFASEGNCEYTETRFNIFNEKQSKVLRYSEMRKETKYSKREIRLVLKYITSMEIFDEEGNLIKTFAQLVKHMKSNTWDELELIYFMNKRSKKVLLYVRSYPGDNEYGLMFDSKERVLASVEDGDIYACR
jgi:hypothetical protein